MAEALWNLKFELTRADPVAWIHPVVREDGHEYYEMLFVYVDDILAISHQARKVVESIGEVYKIKAGSDKEPDIYLGADVEKFQLPDGREVWATSPRSYVKNAIKTVEQLLEEDGQGRLCTQEQCKEPFPIKLQARAKCHRRVGRRSGITILTTNWHRPMGDQAWVAGHLSRNCFVVTVSSESKRRAPRGFVSCICISQETPRHGATCVRPEDD